MNEIRSFLLARTRVTPAPTYYVLQRAEEDNGLKSSTEFWTLSTVDAAAENAADELESAVRSDLAFVNGKAKYLLTAQDSAGAVLASKRLLLSGTAGKPVNGGSDGNGAVNAYLVQLVGKQNGFFLEKCEKLFERQDNVIDALLDANKNLASIRLEHDHEEQKRQDPARQMAEERLFRAIEVGATALSHKFLGGGLPTQKEVGNTVAAGKHAELRAFLANDISDTEIDAILSIVIGANLGNQVVGALTPENFSKALRIMGKEDAP